MDVHFGGRVYLRDNQVTSLNGTYGLGSTANISMNIGQDPSSSLRGWPMARSVDVEGITMSIRPSSSNANLKWKTWLIRQQPDGTNTIFKSPEYQPGRTTRHDLVFAPENMSLDAGDLLSVGFERIGTSGSDTYFLFLDATISLRNP